MTYPGHLSNAVYFFHDVTHLFMKLRQVILSLVPREDRLCRFSVSSSLLSKSEPELLLCKVFEYSAEYKVYYLSIKGIFSRHIFHACVFR